MQRLLIPLVLMPLIYCEAALGDQPPAPRAPKVAAASPEAERAITGFRRPAGFHVRLFAAEPLVANPVAFHIDSRGRIYVCESFRQNKGVTDNRGHDQRWLDDDLAAQTVEDRVAYHRKHLKDRAADYVREDDRIRLIWDENKDGRADHSTVFADRFNRLEDGTGAGVLSRGKDVFFTCIPKLYRLRDNNGDGKADQRQTLHHGYGVRVAFRGHDLHGLTMGPDGKLYYSVGDRGYNIRHEGKRHVNPESGAVFRCNIDGSDLEVFATGLRNPQELAFDEYGNLFTGDNNSDSGDRARWVYVVEGGDTGWRMAYQYLRDRGPFNREKIWHPFHKGQPAYIVPPIANFADGPSGLIYYPGVGLPEEFRGRFLLCDFRGTAGKSGVRSLRVEPNGASFKLVDDKQPFWNILATDIALGPDGRLYVSDWVNGWNGEGKGRIYQFYSKEADSPAAREVAGLLAGGMMQLKDARLLGLLGHADQRVRLESQFELARRGKTERLQSLCLETTSKQLARIHALWALGQIARGSPRGGDSLSPALKLLSDADAEIRAQAAKILGAARHAGAATLLTDRLRDESPRVRYFAALAVGKLKHRAATPALIELLAENENEDPILRHGGVRGLAGAASDSELLGDALRKHSSPAVRVAAVVALRRRANSGVAAYLEDSDPLVVVEAARAIHDVPLVDAMPVLAELLDAVSDDEALIRRALNANFRLGAAEHAARVAKYAAREGAPAKMRLEALNMLADWAKPSSRDRVLGMWRPLRERDAQIPSSALKDRLVGILSGGDQLRGRVLEVAAGLGLKEAAPALKGMIGDAAQPAAARRRALLALDALDDGQVLSVARKARGDGQPLVRAAALTVLARREPAESVDLLLRSALEGEVVERQASAAALANLRDPRADEILGDLLRRVSKGTLPAEMHLDVLDAATRRKSRPLREAAGKLRNAGGKDPIRRYRFSLQGGDQERGRRIFFERTSVSCVRCHRVGGRGGQVGPDLSKIGAEKKRDYLLESIVAPNKTIAKDFETVLVVDADGLVHSGVKKREDDVKLELMTPEGRLITIAQDDIEDRKTGKSAMPEDLLKRLTAFDVRDLVEFLSKLKPK